MAVYEQLGGIGAVQAHVAAVGEYLYDALSALRHANGASLVRVFGKHHLPNRCERAGPSCGRAAGKGQMEPHGCEKAAPFAAPATAAAAGVCRPLASPHLPSCAWPNPITRRHEVQGATLNFLLLSPSGEVHSYKAAGRLLAEGGFHVRTGCGCNPGACYNATGAPCLQPAGGLNGCHAFAGAPVEWDVYGKQRLQERAVHCSVAAGVSEEEVRRLAAGRQGDFSNWEWAEVER